MDLVAADIEEILEFLRVEDSVPRDTLQVARELAKGAFTHLEEIDRLIKEHLRKWDYSRVGNVEKSILRIAVFELLHTPKTPAKVAINEALELGKQFTTWQSVRFLNAVLDKLARQIRPS